MRAPDSIAGRLVTGTAVIAIGTLILASTASAQILSEGALSPGTVVNDASVGTALWVNPGNATASDDTFATTAPGGTPTQYLKASSFGFSLPSPAQIVGIEATIERKSIVGTVVDSAVRIVKGGVVGASDRSDAGFWMAGSDEIITYGSNSDLWGETWTAADINSTGFGVAVSATDSFDTAGVDHITMTVFYTLCGPTPATGCRTSAKSILIVNDKTPNSKDKVVWKWIKGTSTSTAEFADPLATADYSLCIYSGAVVGTASTLIADASVLRDATKWTPISTKGFRYLDKNTTQDGIRNIVLKASVTDKAKAIVKGKGTCCRPSLRRSTFRLRSSSSTATPVSAGKVPTTRSTSRRTSPASSRAKQ